MNPTPGTSTPERTQIATDMLQLYSMNIAPDKFRHYTDDATFEDPVTLARGLPEIVSAFRTLPKLFRSATLVSHNVDYSEADKIKIEVNVKYTWRWIGRVLDFNSLLVLYLRPDNKIWRHEDRWNKKPLPSRSTWPRLGFMFEGIRRANAKMFHWVVGPGDYKRITAPPPSQTGGSE